MDVDPQLVDLGVRLSESAVRNTAGSIGDRIRASKAARTDRETIAELEEIVSQLIEDKNELMQIGQAYEQAFVAQRIRPDEIDYVTNTLVPIIEQLASEGPSQSANGRTPEEVIEALKPLLSVQMITVLQVLGFNFKRAIGEPLTQLVAQLITSRAPVSPAVQVEAQRIATEREIALIELAKDEAAFNRLGGS